MPVTLIMEEDHVGLKTTGLDDDAFKETLSKIRSLPFVSRRWNAKKKVWEFPLDALIIQRVVQTLQPDLDAGVQSWLAQELALKADEVATKLPDDADLEWVCCPDDLYPYQRAGVDFIARHPHSILADDMGLGKTVQAIAASHEARCRMGLVDGLKLVICPNSMKLTWKREIEKWDPMVTGAHTDPMVVVLDGAKDKRDRLIRSLKHHPNAWVIVNWEKLRILPELAKLDWNSVIADEAHRAKNRKALQTKALWKLKAPIQLALSGTPIMNNPDEIWSILKWLYPTQYTSYWRFFEQYVDYYEGHFGRVIVGIRNPDHLRFELADKLARRTKGGVLNLPPKTKVIVPVEMLPAQRRLYDQIEEEFWVEIERDDPDAAERLKSGASLMSIPNAAARCTRLRQVASSPALLGAEDNSAKLDAAVEIITDAKKPVVVFTHFKDTVALLQERLAKAKVPSGRITGDDSPAQREAAMTAFKEGQITVLVCTIFAGGVGLTLTTADTCIFIEEDWVPANNDQAADRLHRIGQQNNVTVFVLQAEDSIDTGRIAPTNMRKRAVVSSIIETDVVPERSAA